jgi:Fur family ferric uptake transcriptional regulator
MTNDTDLGDELKRCGLKSTKHRAAILDILKKSAEPVSAEQVFLMLKVQEIPANLSTVYRTLEALSDKDLATKLNITGDNKALFEYNRMVHRHYLVCLGCRKIKAINSCPLEDYEESLAKETNFSIIGHKLNVYGYCPECAEKGES